jgi:hypothetical protein
MLLEQIAYQRSLLDDASLAEFRMREACNEQIKVGHYYGHCCCCYCRRCSCCRCSPACSCSGCSCTGSVLLVIAPAAVVVVVIVIVVVASPAAVVCCARVRCACVSCPVVS